MINPKEFKEGQLQRIVCKRLSYKNHPEVLEKQVETYFKEFDADNSGGLDRMELKNFFISFFKQYKIRVPITEEFVDTTFTDIDADGDGSVDLTELKNYLGEFIKLLLELFTDALTSYPNKMIDVERHEKAELEATLAELENYDQNNEALIQMCQDYFTEFDADKSG
jgi:Ca2+-binding EF-hand superfamily protein